MRTVDGRWADVQPGDYVKDQNGKWWKVLNWDHVAARLTRGQRRLWLRLQHSWPWARELADAFTRLQALPVPTG